MTAAHPTDRELADFLLGRLADSEQASVEVHFADCLDCRDRALAVPADDTLTKLLAAARTQVDVARSVAATPTLDDAPTPPAFAATQAWGETIVGPDTADLPASLAGHPKYRVIRRLGIGGMGTVWLAEHQVMNRPVAVKVIRPDLLARPGAAARFLREVRAAAKLHHPNIVTAFDAEMVGDSCLLVMEYVPGETLADRLAGGPMPIAEACRAARDAARGLAAAHAAGLVHRDVKPHNLIRSTDGTTKVLDFGLTGVAAGEAIEAGGEGLTGAGMVVGTPAYIAPEQIADPHAADARADIYGLGCTLYHLLAGEPPVPRGSIAETLVAQQCREPDPISGLPPDLAAVLAKMLAKRPEERYQTADEVAMALEAGIGARSASEGGSATLARASGSARKNHLLRWLAIAAGLILVTAAAVVFKIQRDNQEITITTSDESVEVVMKRKGEVVRVIDKKSGQTWEIDTLKNQIAQAETPVGLTLDLPDGEAVVLRRTGDPGGRPVFAVTRTSAPADGEPRRFEGHTAPVNRVALSPDGRLIASTSDDHTVRVWDLQSKKQIHMFQTAYPALPLAFSADSSMLAAVTQGDARRAPRVAAWDLGTGKQLFDLPTAPQWAGAIAYSPDGRWIAFPKDGPQHSSLTLLDARTGREIRMVTAPPGDIIGRAVAVSPDGKEVATTRQIDVCVWDVATGDLVRELKGHTKLVTGIAYAPDGKTVMTVSHDQTVRFWDAQTGEATRTFDRLRGSDPRFTGFCNAISADGRRVTRVTPDRAIEVWDMAAERQLALLKGHTADVAHVVFSADGRLAATACADRVVRLWRLPEEAILSPGEPGLLQRLVGHTQLVRGVALSADGTRALSAAHDGTVRLWDPATGKELQKLDAGASLCTAVVFSSDATHAFASYADGVVRLWDLREGKVVRRFAGHEGLVADVAVSPDGSRAISAGAQDRTVRVWDVGTGKELHCLKGHTETLYHVAISPDGRRVLSGGSLTSIAAETTIRLWDVVEGKEVAHFQAPANCGLAFLDDGRALTAGRNDKGDALQLWDLSTATLIREHRFRGHGFMNLALSGDRRRAVSCGMDKAIRVWDVETLEEAHILRGHGNIVRAVAVSADGRHAVSGGGGEEPKQLSDNSVRLWRLPDLPVPELKRVKAENAGWVPVFNGKDLTGWKTNGKQAQGWRVDKDGVLVGSGPYVSHLFTERGDYADFHLRAEVKINDQGNSGIYLRTAFDLPLKGRFPAGYEAQILSGVQLNPRGREEYMTGSLYGLKKFDKRVSRPDEWFTIEVIARGNQITIKVNEKTTAEYEDPQRTYTTGHIALQLLSHTGSAPQPTVVHFRKIEIKDIGPVPKVAK